MMSFFHGAAEVQGAAGTSWIELNLIMKEQTFTGLLVIRAFTTEKNRRRTLRRSPTRDLKKINLFVNRGHVIHDAGADVRHERSQHPHRLGRRASGGFDGSLMIGDMLAYLQYAMHVIMSFLYITMMFIMLPRAAVSYRPSGSASCAGRRADRSRDQRTDAEDLQHAKRQKSSFRARYRSPIRTQKKRRWTISAFTAKPGQTTAIIGGTGCGKSTLIKPDPAIL